VMWISGYRSLTSLIFHRTCRVMRLGYAMGRRRTGGIIHKWHVRFEEVATRALHNFLTERCSWVCSDNSAGETLKNLWSVWRVDVVH
jgi:hypothetical protein